MTFRLNEGMLFLLVRVILIFHLKCKLFDIPEDLHLETTRRDNCQQMPWDFLNAFAIYSKHLFIDLFLNHTIPTVEVM
jgi:hypothetical protein